jgi:hypothetical protein
LALIRDKIRFFDGHKKLILTLATPFYLTRYFNLSVAFGLESALSS